MNEPHALAGHVVAVTSPTYLDHLCALNIESKSKSVRLTSIICTIGPSSTNVDTLEGMIEEGMSVACLNLMYGNHESLELTIKNVKEAASSYAKKSNFNCSVAIAVETRGPQMRIGTLEGGPSTEVELIKDQTVVLTTDTEYQFKCSSSHIYIDHHNLTKFVKPGKVISLDHGNISLIAKNITGHSITCTVDQGGKMSSQSVVNIPGVLFDLPTVSGSDKKDLQFAAQHEIDFVFASFVRSATGVKEIRDVLGEAGKNIRVIAKIENYQGLQKLDEIIEAADGLMIYKFDVGLDMAVEKVFMIQKVMIAKCNRQGKPVICASQMLESMTKKSKPSRSENLNVASAILDGADCVMLTSETAIGEHPVECIRAMASIVREAEASIWRYQLFSDRIRHVEPPIEATHNIAIASVEVATMARAAAIIVSTTSGRSAYMVSKYRPNCPVIAVTRHPQVARQANLYRGIVPVYYDKEASTDWLKDCDDKIIHSLLSTTKKGFLQEGDQVIAITGWKHGTGYTNTLRIVSIPRNFEANPSLIY